MVAAAAMTISALLIGPTTALAAAPAPAPAATPPATSSTASPATAPTTGATTPTRARSTTIAAPPKRRPTGSAPCGGKLTYGKVETCASIVGAQENAWTFTTTVDSDTLLARLNSVSGSGVGARVTDRDGGFTCHVGAYLNECRLGPAGTYTLTVTTTYGTGEGSYTLSVESMRTPSECDTLPEPFFSFASAGVSGTLPAGLAARCFKFDQPTGTRLHLADPSGTGDVQASILDGRYEPLGCPIRYTTECTLTEPGPYRLFLHESYGNEAAYTLRMPRLSQAVGCPTVPLAPFGDPGAAVGQGSVAAPEEVACHSLTTDAAGAVVVRFNRYQDQYLSWGVYDATGQRICDEYSSARHCFLPAAGTYILLVQNRNDVGNAVDYQVAVTALHRIDGCVPATGTSWETAALVVHQTSPVQTNCQPFHAEAGDRIITYTAPDRYNEAAAWLVDADGTVLCTEWSEQDGCVVPATGTYRVVSYLANWDDDSTDLTYKMQVRRLSDAVGCPTVTPGAYGTGPAGGLGGIRCRTLDVATAGTYRLHAVGDDNYERYGRVYDQAGLRVCGTGRCEIPAAGRYTLVLGDRGTGEVIDNDVRHAVALLPWAPSNCTPVSDNGWRDAPHRGTFPAAGQVNCLQLASPAGSRIVQSQPGDTTFDASPEITIVDATGEYLCDYSSLRQYTCELTGEAPFHAVLTGPEGSPVSAYTMAFSRVDGPPACAVLPRGDTGATATTGADRFVACWSVPADEHAARESFTWTRTSGTGDARLSVIDSRGIRYCGPTGHAVERTVTCTLPAGPVTVLLESDAVDATYRLTHRDAATPTS
ncbi:hypothetical protein GA0070614_3013 [Micromonospora coxensis]|uniref:Ig-like domain-containing protein n=2 Tax=Micromonospora coxensis TaxID=356852 RepID=A0A1C5IMC0_9ACTN|nr:hypothetical protein GA0070614_3013 [Micromonospora coxensis]